MPVIGGARTSGDACTVSAMPVVIIWEYLRSIRCPGIVDGVIECYNFGVICRVVIIQIVQSGVVTVDSSINYCHGHSFTGVTSVLPYQINTVSWNDILHLYPEDSVQLDENDSWKVD